MHQQGPTAPTSLATVPIELAMSGVVNPGADALEPGRMCSERGSHPSKRHETCIVRGGLDSSWVRRLDALQGEQERQMRPRDARRFAR